MSDAYAEERGLVREEATYVDRGLETAIALTVVSFLLGMVTLVKAVSLATSGAALTTLCLQLLAVGVGGVGSVAALSYLNVLPITSSRVRGIGTGLVISLIGLAVLATVLPVTLATLLGIVLLAEAGAAIAVGLLSWTGLYDTEPSPSAGLLAGLAFGLVGMIIGAAVSSALLPDVPFALVFPDGTVFVLDLADAAAALAIGSVLAVATMAPPEDLGTALPVAVLVGGLGLLIVTGTVDLGWTWSPGSDIDGAVTGGVAIPLFVLLGSIVSSWGVAKGRAGYGAVGRQFGSFLVIYLNAALMLAIMVAIVAFVVMKGATYTLHGFSIGALSGLVLLAPLLVVVIDWARTPAGSEEWHSGARQAIRAIPVAVIGGLAGLLALLQLTGRTVAHPFQYTVQQNQNDIVLDTAATITTEPTVGTLVLLISGVVTGWYVRRKAGHLQGTPSDRLVAVERWLGLAIGAMALLVTVLFVGGTTVAGVALGETLGLGAVAAATAGAGALTVSAAGPLAVGTGPLSERFGAGGHRIRIGLFGGVGLLGAASILEPVAGINPSVLGVNVVPAMAVLGALLSGLTAVVTVVLARSSEGRAERTLRTQSAIGLTAAFGFVVVVALHVALTQVDFTILGVTVGVTGTLSWPMTMSPYIPLTPNPGGIMPAIVGTAWLVTGASLFAVPLGVGAAVFLTEYAEQGKFTALVEIATNSLWSTPSVVFGLFGAAFLFPRLGGDESLLAAMLVLGFMLLPLVLITSREAIKSVPDEYRDASAALGVTQWETIKSVVLPAAMPGVITGVILGVGRIAGETAPLILVLGSTLNSTSALDVLGGFEFVGHPPFVENPTLLEASAAVPTQVWAVISAGVSGSESMGWASALVLLLIVLSFYAVGIIARTYFRRKLNYE